MTREFIDFVRSHESDDTARLLLSAARYPGIDMPLAVQQIEGRRTAREKWPSLLENEEFLYPPRLNREQASSETTARYKAALLPVGRAADLTGGMGIDALALAQVAQHVDYVERDSALCGLVEHNCRALGVANVSIHCADSMEWAATQGFYDLIFIDPSRRGAAGRRVAAFEDCTPNLLNNLPMLRSHCQWLMVKASPMIDIRRAMEQLGTVGEVHIVAVHGECKELLFLCSEEPCEPVIKCAEPDTSPAVFFSFSPTEEATAIVQYSSAAERYLYDPHAALRKAGCFRLLGQRCSLPLLAPNTHLYTSDELVDDFPGRIFEVLRELPLNSKAAREALPDGKAHVVVRNFPAEAAALQRQLGLTEGGTLYVIATTLGSRRLGLLCRQV